MPIFVRYLVHHGLYCDDASVLYLSSQASMDARRTSAANRMHQLGSLWGHSLSALLHHFSSTNCQQQVRCVHILVYNKLVPCFHKGSVDVYYNHAPLGAIDSLARKC